MKKILLILTMLVILPLTACDAAPNDMPGGELGRFFPFKPDTLVTFTVEGTEDPGFRTIYNTYIRENRVQRMISATMFPPSTEIIEITDDQVRLIFGDPFHYSVEDLTGVTPSLEFVILQAPLEVGTTWNNGAEVSTITSLDASIETPLGTLSALEVTTITSAGFEEKYYFADGIGLIKSVHPNPLGTFVVTLYEIEHDVPANLPMIAIFPDIENNTAYGDVRFIHARTNADLLPLFAHELATAPSNDMTPLLPDSSLINSMQIFRTDNFTHVDISPALNDWQGLGDGAIYATFMALVNTIGLFTEVTHVSFSMNGELFEWGPILLNLGEGVRVHDFTDPDTAITIR